MAEKGDEVSQLEFDVLRIKDIAALIGISRWTLQRWVDEGNFPAPNIVGGSLKVWRRDTVEKWIVDSLNPPHNKRPK